MIEVEWIDAGREPQSAPDPAYPEGIDVDVSAGRTSCEVDLPYPARRCGYYVLSCGLCGGRFILTTAGRPDDPRSARVPCVTRAPEAEA
jgi:hypothetical protein